MATDRPYLVLGLDPGIASCGFCLLDMTNHKILEMGTHLFKAPQEDKTKTSLAVKRRNARSIRRNTLRTKTRLKHCMKLFKEAGLVPTDADKSWFQSKKGTSPFSSYEQMGSIVCSPTVNSPRSSTLSARDGAISPTVKDALEK